MVRKTTAAFGTLFKDIQIIRVDPIAGTTTQTVNVPLLYGSKDKAYVRRTEDPDTAFNMKTTYPRMSFLMRTLERDQMRKMNPLNRHRDGVAMQGMYEPVPYNFHYELYIESKHLEDGFQVVEQILPFFNPEYTISTNLFSNLYLQKEIKVVLDSVDFNDEAPDTEFDAESVNDWTLSFTVQSYLFMPIDAAKRIESIEADFFATDPNLVLPDSIATIDVNGNTTISHTWP